MTRFRTWLPFAAALPFAVWCVAALSQEDESAPAPAQTPAIVTYASKCFENLHLDPADLAGPFDCTHGTRLVTAAHGMPLDRDKCHGAGCPTGLPPECDLGTWLDDSCYGHSYLQVIPTPSNPKVKAALLCRHKSRWEGGPAPLLDLDDNLVSGFDDVAMIVHNSGNGETCWFQSPDGKDVHLDGTRVPGPATVTRDDEFWNTPTQTSDVMCVKCHDSGPWMSSPWIYTQAGETLGLAGSSGEPYKNSTPPFDRWPEPKFVKLADDDTCTSCHAIAAARRDVHGEDSLGGPHFKTCTEWIERTTGWAGHLKATTPEGTADSLRYWMPYGHGLTAAEWESQYRAAVERIKACCMAVGTQPKTAWPKGCEEDFPVPSCPVKENDDGSCPVDLEF